MDPRTLSKDVVINLLLVFSFIYCFPLVLYFLPIYLLLSFSFFSFPVLKCYHIIRESKLGINNFIEMLIFSGYKMIIFEHGSVFSANEFFNGSVYFMRYA